MRGVKFARIAQKAGTQTSLPCARLGSLSNSILVGVESDLTKPMSNLRNKPIQEWTLNDLQQIVEEQ
jgi:hypothetical protein